eukprot:4800572-Prymnesium_polylepis.1
MKNLNLHQFVYDANYPTRYGSAPAAETPKTKGKGRFAGESDAKDRTRETTSTKASDSKRGQDECELAGTSLPPKSPTVETTHTTNAKHLTQHARKSALCLLALVISVRSVQRFQGWFRSGLFRLGRFQPG